MKYICLIVLAPNFMTKIGKKAAQDFFCAVSKVFDRVKTVALWSAKKIKNTIKGYGSAATNTIIIIFDLIKTRTYDLLH